MKRAHIAIIISGSVAVFTIVFFFLLQGKLYDALVVPLARDYYILWFYVTSMPQAGIWLAIASVFSFILFTVYRRTARTLPRWRPRSAPVHSQPQTDNPLQLLATAIRYARRFPVYRYTVVHELAELAIRIIARRDQVPLPEARRRFKTGKWCNNTEVRDFLEYERLTTGVKFDSDFDRKLATAIDYLEHLEQGG